MNMHIEKEQFYWEDWLFTAGAVLSTMTKLRFGGLPIGPVAPTPKKLGIILASDSPEAFNIMLCKLMVFCFESIPLIREVTKEKKEINIRSNVGNLQGKLKDIEIPTD